MRRRHGYDNARGWRRQRPGSRYPGSGLRRPCPGSGADVAPKPKDGKVVCPGIILKVGPTVMLPCRRGAEIVEARSVEVDGRYCAKVTYIAEAGSPPRTETLCEGDVLSVGG